MEIKSKHEVTEHPEPGKFKPHIHEQCEVYNFLEGDADYFVEGRVYKLHRGDLILTRPMELHHLILHSGKRYERNFINFSMDTLDDLDDGRIRSMFYERPIGRFNHFPALMFPERTWQHYLECICNTQSPKRQKIYLAAFLDELTDAYEKLKESSDTIDTIDTNKTSEIIGYIDRHLYDKLTLEKICVRFFISKTHLNKIFKDNTGTTVWDYIVAKRLISARERICCGEMPTKVSEACGFENYTTFYKAYKKRFGLAPSK